MFLSNSFMNESPHYDDKFAMVGDPLARSLEANLVSPLKV